MSIHLKTAAAFITLSSLLGTVNLAPGTGRSTPQINRPVPKIQAAILLDVSNSMDGLIEQAKLQLWNMVNVMGKAKCGDATPQIEIALYEYGTPPQRCKAGFCQTHQRFHHRP